MACVGSATIESRGPFYSARSKYSASNCSSFFTSASCSACGLFCPGRVFERIAPRILILQFRQFDLCIGNQCLEFGRAQSSKRPQVGIILA